jgi:photoactive yellow protein
MSEELLNLSAAEIDSLPFGYIALDPEGNIRKYNRYEADLARKDPQKVLGKNFFREVAPCTQVQDFEGRFRRFADGEIEDPTLAFDFEFAFRHGTQKVRIGFVRSPLEKEVIVTVNRIRNLELAMSAELQHQASVGRLADATDRPVVVANPDFWQALESLHADRDPEERHAELHRLGVQWGLQHALRVEGFVQRQQQKTLREVELQLALESLSGSIGTLGLGHFDVHLGYRDRGILLVEHHESPFAALLADRDAVRCDLLAGLHAGFLSYLSGRYLVAREIGCSSRTGEPCRFVVGTERRLERLLDPVPGSVDAHLLVALGVRPPRGGEEASDG